MLLNCGVGEDSWESLDYKEIQPVSLKGDQSWVFIGRTDAGAEIPTHRMPDVKNWLIWKDPDGGKDLRQEEKGMTEDEMVGWHHRLDGNEFEWGPGVSNWLGSLACWSPWGHKESDMTVQLTWLMYILLRYMNICKKISNEAYPNMSEKTLHLAVPRD